MKAKAMRPGSIRALRILSSTARGVLIPHTLADIQQTLARLGHEVWVQDNVGVGAYEQAVIAIVDGLVRVAPEVVFTVDQVALLPDVISVLAQPPRVISWAFDNPFNFLRDDFLAINSHFHFFCWDQAYLAPLAAKGYRHLYHQPFATNPGVYRPAPGTGYDYDLSFVGTSSVPRMAALHALVESGLRVDVFGDEGWKNLGHPRISYHGPASNREDCPRIFSRSRINLNITSEQLLTSVPLRVFDVLACGGFLLTDARAGLPELFKPGKDLAVYTSLAELCAKARYYLDHPDERDAVRKHGRIRVLRDYTFDIVLPGIIERALAGTPDYALNRMLDPGKMARALLLAGLAYLKFNQPEQARPRLLDALNLAPESPAHLLAAALLAGRAGQAGAVRACAEKLVALGEPAAAWGRELLEDGHALPAWDRVYRAIFPEARVRPDGTVAGWEARRVAP